MRQSPLQSKVIFAFWCRIPSRGNVGDRLTPWLIHHISGSYPIFVRPEASVTKYFVSGSILEYAQERCVIWGTGIISRHDYVSRQASLLAVRGPITRQIALAQGAECPEVYGDPALLLPRFYHPSATVHLGLGLIPHFSDLPQLLGLDSRGIDLINVQSPVENFIDQVCAHKFIASSSLHGLIISHAYGIPATWIKFRDLPSGDDSKFYDYFASVGLHEVQPLRVHPSNLDASVLVKQARVPTIWPDLDLLWENCPFR
jgi:pyruvyltransferase